jgi:hypothetical protein
MEVLNLKLKNNIKITLKMRPDALEEKINTYLVKNSYRITERGQGYIIFVEDQFSDRRKSKSDSLTRIGEGKFKFAPTAEGETNVELIYFTSISSYIFIVMLVSAFGIYTNNIIMPIIFSIVFTTPILFRIFYLDGHVFKEIMQC